MVLESVLCLLTWKMEEMKKIRKFFWWGPLCQALFLSTGLWSRLKILWNIQIWEGCNGAFTNFSWHGYGQGGGLALVQSNPWFWEFANKFMNNNTNDTDDNSLYWMIISMCCLACISLTHTYHTYANLMISILQMRKWKHVLLKQLVYSHHVVSGWTGIWTEAARESGSRIWPSSEVPKDPFPALCFLPSIVLLVWAHFVSWCLICLHLWSYVLLILSFCVVSYFQVWPRD